MEPTQIRPLVAKIAPRVSEFWQSVDVAGPDDCWPWTGYIEDEYGKYFFEGRMRPAHELAVTFTTGERRARGLGTFHTCNNRPCCNPQHVRFGSRSSSDADGTMLGKTGKLTPTDVETIRLRLSHGARQQDLADQFGVTNGFISMIKKGKRHAA